LKLGKQLENAIFNDFQYVLLQNKLE